jgi:parvulin-like peptidyl-prolyl isomerase
VASPRSRLRLGAFALVLALSLSGCGDAALRSAAVVNGSRITDGELRANLPLYRLFITQSGGQCGQAEGAERPAAACVRFVLSRLIAERIVVPYAVDNGVRVDASELARAFRSLIQSPQVKELISAGVTREEVRDFLRRLLLLRDAQVAVAARTVTDPELRRLYEQNKAQFAQIHVAHILVRSRSLAERIAREATPENFGRLARKYSTDPGSKDKGGDLGLLPATQLDPDFVRAALALSPGEISGAVQTRFGWHVIRLISEKITPFEQARPQLLQGFAGQAFTRWLSARLRRADVEVNPRYGRFDPAKGEVVSICSTSTVPPAGECAPTPSAPPAS